jgi:uncharacterized protein (TIGR02452 family)
MEFSASKLVKVYENTKLYCNSKCIKPPKIAVYNEEVCEHNMSSDEHNMSSGTPSIKVLNEDCLRVAQNLITEGVKNVCVLNMASDIRPGGGVAKGSRAQEEDIFRRTNISRALDVGNPNLVNKFGKVLYPFNKSFSNTKGYKGEDVAIFCKDVVVVKDENYELLKESFEVDVISVAAIRQPKLEQGKLNSYDEALMMQKIDQIFKIAHLNEANALVLGALGCGAFKNPPEHVSELFKKYMETHNLPFTHIYFAVLSTDDNPNFEIFSKTLSR